jgi:hypothetical protein
MEQLLKFSLLFFVSVLLFIFFYKSEKKNKYSEKNDYSLINSYKRFGILISVIIIALINIILQLIKII